MATLRFSNSKQGKQGNHLEIIWCMFHFAMSWYHCDYRALFIHTYIHTYMSDFTVWSRFSLFICSKYGWVRYLSWQWKNRDVTNHAPCINRPLTTDSMDTCLWTLDFMYTTLQKLVWLHLACAIMQTLQLWICATKRSNNWVSGKTVQSVP